MNDKKATLQRIYETFRRMERICESTHEWDRYFDECVIEERNHRKHAPEGTKFGISVRETAQIFAVRNVFAALAQIGFQPQAKDYFGIKGTVFMGVAMADIKKTELVQEFTDLEMIKFHAEVDYCKLIKV